MSSNFFNHMISFPSSDPNGPDRQITPENAQAEFNDIVQNDDDRIVRRLVKEVLESNNFLLQVFLHEALAGQLQVEFRNLEMAESHAQFDAIQKNIDFVLSVFRKTSEAVYRVVDNN